MAHKPVIFLSFANDNDAYLASLKAEEDYLYESLQDAHDAGYLEIYNRGRATIDDIFANFTRFRDRIVIFHYGGHASGTQLKLEDRDANSSGLAKLMGQQENLKLVFLNGCSTKGQVDELLNAGVKALIATSVPINDEKAVVFAKQFYESLADDATIEEAFNEAVSRLETEGYTSAKDINIIRSSGTNQNLNTDDLPVSQTRDFSLPGSFESEPEKDENQIPWGLYVNDESILAWKLPKVNKSVFSDPWVGTASGSETLSTIICESSRP